MAQGVFTYKAVRIYDGDTVWAAIRFGQGGEGEGENNDKGAGDDAVYNRPRERRTWRVCCRLLRIDTPEMPRSHVEAMTDYHQKAYAARDRLVELLTDCTFDDVDKGNAKDSSGNRLPSLSDVDLQKRIDANSIVIEKGLDLKHGRDKYGRYLAELKTKDGRNASDVLLEEGHATRYDGGGR